MCLWKSSYQCYGDNTQTVTWRGLVMPGATAWLYATYNFWYWAVAHGSHCYWRYDVCDVTMTPCSPFQSNVLAKFDTCILFYTHSVDQWFLTFFTYLTPFYQTRLHDLPPMRQRCSCPKNIKLRNSCSLDWFITIRCNLCFSKFTPWKMKFTKYG